jgi:hypothetical protein
MMHGAVWTGEHFVVKHCLSHRQSKLFPNSEGEYLEADKRYLLLERHANVIPFLTKSVYFCMY